MIRSFFKRNALLDRVWLKGLEEIVGPLAPLLRIGPQAEPWKVGVEQLTQATIANTAASKQNNPPGPRAANQAKDASLDDWCGTPPRRIPWPFPGPPPWLWQLASELALLANSLEAGKLRAVLDEHVGKLVGRANHSQPSNRQGALAAE